MSQMGTVLYIDDERQVPAGFEEELRDAGYRLLYTADPDDALRLVRVEEIDLVLAEVVLFTCNGIALLEEIRSYGGWPAQVPIIVLTKGERSPDLYGGALELGVKEFFTKPALKAELLESVRQFAGKV
jgi:DNA-binding response OmpR family regulator